MAEYRVNLSTVASFTATVEADDEESAIEAAYELAPSTLCHQCAGLVDINDAWEYEQPTVTLVR